MRIWRLTNSFHDPESREIGGLNRRKTERIWDASVMHNEGDASDGQCRTPSR